jgi:hypothetical protein
MRIKFNSSWEEDEEEKRQYFAALSYSERLKFYLRSRKVIRFHPENLKRFDFRLSDSRLPKAPYL